MTTTIAERLRASLEAHPDRRNGSRCTVARILDSLDDDARDIVSDWIADDTLTSARIARALSDEGYQLSASTMRRHRAEGCTCGR